MGTELSPVDPASPWMKHLERAHSLVHEAARRIEEESEPNAHLAPAAKRLERAVVAMYDAFDGRADRVTSLGLAQGRVWEAAVLVARGGLPRALASLREACGEIIAAEERFPRVPLAGRNVVPLRAGVDLPPLHVVERASLTPSFRAPPLPEPAPEAAPVESTLPEPTTFEELEAAAQALQRKAREQAKRPVAPPRLELERGAPTPVREEAPPGFAFAPGVAISEGDFVRRWARVCFEEIGMLGVQRAPLPGDDWRACQSLELRMIAAIDALAALGSTAIRYVEDLAMDAPTASPMSVFAMAMIGGCLEGRDALAGAERVLSRFGSGDPLVAEAFASAMKLAPSPFLPGVLRSLYASREPGSRAIAVEVLGHRGWLTPEEFDGLVEEEDPSVLSLALPALAAARHREFERAATCALVHADLRLQAAALDAMALAASPRAASAARAAAEGAPGERALVRLALVGDEEDARWLLDRMQAAPTPSAVEAVGWAGLVEAVPALLRLLEAEEQAIRLAAGAALERLLGAHLIEQIEVLPEALEEVEVKDPDPEPTRLREALAVLVSHPRDLPSAGSSETLEVPSTDPAKWRAHWVEHGRRYNPKQRLRRGQPYSPSVSLYELDKLPVAVEDRRRLHRELAARTGKVTHFDPYDFVVTQGRSLEAWASLVRAWVETPGSWGRPTPR